MPYVIQNGDRLQVKAYCTDNSQTSVNTFYLLVTSIVSGALTDQLAINVIEAALAPLFKPILNNGASWDGATLRAANHVPLPVAAFSNANAGAGTGGAIGLPKQTCGLTSWRTDLAGPAFRGRTYWPFPSTDLNHFDGKPTPAALALYDDIGAFFDTLASITSGANQIDVDYVLWSKRHLVTVPITSRIQENRWATQRKRGDYGRPNVPPF